MKLSWKLFFITTPLFVIFLTVFGTWIIQDSFWNNLNKEVERCTTENQMFQNSYELTMHALSEVQIEQLSMEQVVESFYRERGSKEGNVRIYGEDGETLYQENELKVENTIRDALDGDNNVGWELVRQEGEPYIVVQSLSSLGVRIETIKSAGEIFENRQAMYSSYRIGVILMTALVGGVLLFVLFLVMRNMKKLSGAARSFARGQYDTRVDVRSRDEVGMLATDFNWMADAMCTQMERLQDEVYRQEEFTNAFAHELKTPLTSIIGYADTIRQMELTPEETDMCADYIYHQGKRLQSLSYKLLDMTLAGKQEITYRAIQAPQLFEEVERTVLASLAEKQLSLDAEAQEGVIYGDWDLLLSLFINLIDNARKASEAGKTIWFRGMRAGESYMVTVEDEGRGIPPEQLSRITEAFYMVDKSRSRKEGGAGLGLALCQRIVNVHQAGWQFESQPGKGLKVTVLFGAPEGVRRERRARRAVRESRRSRKQDGK